MKMAKDMVAEETETIADLQRPKEKIHIVEDESKPKEVKPEKEVEEE